MATTKKNKSDVTTISTLYVDGTAAPSSLLTEGCADILKLKGADRQEVIEHGLRLNQSFQELLSKNIAEAIRLLNENRSQQGTLQEALDELRTNSSRPAVSSAKVPSGTFMPPYFRDRANMIPPWSQECIRIKEQYRLFNPLDDIPKKWLDREASAMKKSIKEMSMAIKMKPLLHRKDLLVEKLKPLEEQPQSSIPNGEGESDGDEARRRKKQKLPVRLEDIKIEIQRKDREINKISTLTPTDDLLRSISVEDIDWWKISNFDMKGRRNPFECQIYWINYLQPGWNIRKDWEQKEVSSLKTLVDTALAGGEKPNWDDIAETLGTCRTPFMIFEKYQSELNDALIKRLWSPEEDELLSKVVDHCRTGDYVPWVQVAYFLDGRTIPQCELRYKRVLSQNVRKGSWLIEEDMRLLDAVARFSGRDWQKIADLVGTRNEIQCRDRWKNVLDGNINHGPWTCEEDERIRFGMDLFGNAPAKVAKLLPGRTGAMTDKRMKHIIRTPPQRLDKLSRQRVFISLSQKYWKNEVGDAYPLLGGPDSSLDKTEQFLYTLPDGIRFKVLEKLMDIRSNLFLHHLKSAALRKESASDQTISSSLRPLRMLPSDVKIGEIEKKLLNVLLVKQHTSYYSRRVEFVKDYLKLKLGLTVIEDLAVALPDKNQPPEKESPVPTVLALPCQASISALYRMLIARDFGPEPLLRGLPEPDVQLLANGNMESPEISILHTETSSTLNKSSSEKVTSLFSPNGEGKQVMAGYSKRSRKRVSSNGAHIPRAKRPRRACAVDHGNWRSVVAADPCHSRFFDRLRSVLLYPTILSTDVLSAEDGADVQVVNSIDA